MTAPSADRDALPPDETARAAPRSMDVNDEVMTMLRIVFLFGAATLATTPLAAQDMPGAVDLGALGRTQVQSGAARGYAERGGAWTAGPNGVPLSAKARAYCEDYPNLLKRHGKADPRVGRLATACNRAGYRY